MKDEVTSKQLRSFGLMVGGLFGFMALWPLIWRGDSVRLWAVILSGLLAIPAVIFPMSLKLIYRGWMAIGSGLGWMNTRIILGIVFYGAFTPLAILLRMSGKDPMRRKWDPALETYREVRTPRDGSHMQRQF